MECFLATNWRNVVAGSKFLVASLYNVNDAIHSMVISIRVDCLQTKVSINLEEKLALFMRFFHIFFDESKVR